MPNQNDAFTNNLRPGQKGAFKVCMERLEQGQQYTTIVLPTRYGKSDVMRLVAWYARKWGLISTTLILSPNKYLRDQMVQEEKLRACQERHHLVGPFSRITLASQALKAGINGEIVISTTMQLISSELEDIWVPWVAACKNGFGKPNLPRKPPLVIIDEAHSGSEANKWGHAVERLTESGALAILMTATPFREDGDAIVGFETEITDQTDIEQYIARDGSTPEKVRVELWGGSRFRRKLIPHYEMTFAEAFFEIPPTLCQMDLLPFDVNLSGLEISGVPQALSQIDDGELRTKGILGKIIENRDVIRQGVDRFVQTLQTYRKMRADCAGIIFCGNDDQSDKEVNRHAKKIRDELLRCDPTLDILIVTSSIDESEDKVGSAEKQIREFVAGKHDVLIVKQMASLGLDAPRIKVGLDLSPTRTLVAGLQRMMRIATIYDDIKTCAWIAPDDKIVRGIFKYATGQDSYIDPAQWKTTLDALLKSYEKDKEEKKRKQIIVEVDGTEPSDFEDSKFNTAEAQLFSSAASLFDAFPHLLAITTHTEAAARLKTLGITIMQDNSIPKAEDVSLRINDLKEEISAVANDIASGRVNANGGYTPENYRRAIKDVWNDYIYGAGVIPHDGGTHYERLADLETLEEIKSIFQNGRVAELL